MLKLRDYQVKIAATAKLIALKYRIVYLAMEVRTGKTLVSLETAKLLGANKVLFVTKKKAISSIVKDVKFGEYSFEIEVINYEQLHKYVGKKYDVIVVDEAHSLGAFPKPSERVKNLRQIRGLYHIFLSGTPSPESYSQWFHQLTVSEVSPWREYANFYKWAKVYVDIKQRMISGRLMNDYSKGKEDRIKRDLAPLIITYSQKDAGFEQPVREEVKWVVPQEPIDGLAHLLLKTRYYKFKDGNEVVADTPVKLQSKIHQISSGTIKTETGVAKILDKYKANYIKSAYEGQKIAIYYKFIAEGELLREVFGDALTESPEEFNTSTDKIFISQIQSGSMGVNLSTADVIVMMNIDFSATLYWQVRARMQDKDRTKECKLHWVFNPNGIESKVLGAVAKKKDYNLKYFRRDYGFAS